MGTPFQKVYNALLVMIKADDWDAMTQEEMNIDLYHVMLSALPWFKFPRIPLTITESDDGSAPTAFDNELKNQEIQVIAHFMKYAWYGRVIDSYENLQPLYQERDFSPAKMLGEFRQKQESTLKLARKLENAYYRSVDGKPFDFSQLSGGGNS